MPTRVHAGGFNVLGLVYLGTVFLAVFFPVLLGRFISRHKPPDSNSDDDSGRGPGRPPHPPAPPSSPLGGLPLPDAEPAKVRLRGHGPLGARRWSRHRRPAHEPERQPVRSTIT